MATRTDLDAAPLWPWLALGALAILGCGEAAPVEEAEDSWSVTAWGELYEVFPEVEPLIAGSSATAHTHVTVLDGFTAVEQGAVEIVLRGEGREEVFRSDQPSRPGIFNVELRPEVEGERELLFRIESPAGREEIRGGRVRVGSAQRPGRPTVAPAPRAASGAGEPFSFLKEQQWRADFGTTWVREGTLASSVRGIARVQTPAGGEARVTAPVAGVLSARPWPFPGRTVEAGESIFRLVPNLDAERSLSALDSAARTVEVELSIARARLQRLEELFAAEATSVRELEEGRGAVAVLTSRLEAARGDLAAARAARSGVGGETAMALGSPLSGAVAEVTASPGAAVSAGEALARVVRTDRVWIETRLPPSAAVELRERGVVGLVVDTAAGPRELEAAEVWLVTVAPEVDATTGTVSVLLETLAAPFLVLGSTMQVEVLLGGERAGVVVPVSGLVDDGGVDVVYLQLAGETFVREEVNVASRQGDRALVEGLVPGQRLVVRGGDAVRRATLTASGAAEGHVH
ncbi:MAG TPA: efflux RND transporter periplasmic adaptor subunit [Thermoanaerobaculia bacterium]|nr:efflux RND transporter periplasmic adaptor subunit [Thermoanaerobaculia bacterium]